MKILRTIDELGSFAGSTHLAIGVFDGLHLGHQAVIGRALEAARQTGGNAVVVTFDPHPVRVLRPEKAPRLLTSTRHKVKLIESWESTQCCCWNSRSGIFQNSSGNFY